MKKVVLLLLATMLCTSMYAQRSGQSQRGGRSATPSIAQKKHAVYVGLKGGLDITSMTQPDECDLYDGAGLGGNIGVVGKMRFGRSSDNSFAGTGLFGAGLELKYKKNSVKTIGTDQNGNENANLSVGYFEVPVYGQIYPFYKTNKMNTFYFELGPVFAGTIGRSPKSLTVMDPSENLGSVTYNFDNGDSQLKGGDLRVMMGLGYDFAIRNSKREPAHLLGVNARYYMGTSKLAGNFPCKMNTFELSFSYMFNVWKL